MIRRPPRSTLSSSSAASDVYKRQNEWRALYDELRKKFSERALVGAGLVVEGEGGKVWDRFRDRITIPIRSARGRIIAYGGRALGDENPKYLNSPETSLFSKGHVLFALDRAMRAFPKANRAVVVEGYFDCIALHRCLLYTSPSPRDRTRSRMPSS